MVATCSAVKLGRKRRGRCQIAVPVHVSSRASTSHTSSLCCTLLTKSLLRYTHCMSTTRIYNRFMNDTYKRDHSCMSKMNHNGMPKPLQEMFSFSRETHGPALFCSTQKEDLCRPSVCAPVQGADVDCVKLGARWTMNSSMARLRETLM